MDSFVNKTDVNPDSASDSYDLTSREIQILRHLALGKSDQDISVDLNISVKTVNVHVSKIILKLKVNNRTHAVAKALVIKQIEMRASDSPNSPPNKPTEQRKVARTNVFKIRGMSVKRSDDD